MASATSEANRRYAREYADRMRSQGMVTLTTWVPVETRDRLVDLAKKEGKPLREITADILTARFSPVNQETIPGAKPKVYIAGPDVFFPDWPDRAQAAQDACAALGLEAVLPVPAQPLAGPGITEPGSPDQALAIFNACLGAIAQADAVVANLMPFRGGEPDSGTVVECAAAYFLGKFVIGYTPITNLGEALSTERQENGFVLCDGSVVEQFGLPCNLMLDGVCREILSADMPAALARVAEVLSKPQASRSLAPGVAPAGLPDPFSDLGRGLPPVSNEVLDDKLAAGCRDLGAR